MEYILILFMVVAILLIAATHNNYKRINQLERDMTEQRIVEPTAREKAKEILLERNATEQVNVVETLEKAGVTERKAHVAGKIAIFYNWKLLDIQANIKMVRFIRTDSNDVQKVNVYYGGKGGKSSLYTVATALNHPTKGKTQLFRKEIDQQELEAILDNPRAHTRKGYYQGGGKN